jgi:hypothetical protein
VGQGAAWGFRLSATALVGAALVGGVLAARSPASVAHVGTAGANVTSFSPAAAVFGTKVTLTGTLLDGATAVTFHGSSVLAPILSDTATKLVVTVPNDATAGINAFPAITQNMLIVGAGTPGLGTIKKPAFAIVAYGI